MLRWDAVSWGLVLVVATSSGCALARAHALPARSLALGETSFGRLHRGVPLTPRRGVLELARPDDPAHVGTSELVALLGRAADAVATAHPGGMPLRVGDLAAPLGGRHPRHRSHRAGRDVDVSFFQTDAEGRSIPSRSAAFSRFGVARTDEGVTLFDDARNWTFVRALLADAAVPVQWIFCSRGVKTRLLRYALDHEPDHALVLRAAYVLAQPSDSAPHDDHFHVRVFCADEERALGCRDVGPRWPWLRHDVEEMPALPSDDELLERLDAP